MRYLFLSLMVALSACKQKQAAPAPVSDEPPVRAVVAGMDMIDYKEPSGAFTCRGPADWQLYEENDLGPEARFMGPGTKALPNTVMISISRYPNKVDKSPDPKHYFDGMKMTDGLDNHKMVVQYEKIMFGGREVYHYARTGPFRRLHERVVRYTEREDYFAIPAADGGFYRIDHSAPVDIYKDSFPILEAVVASFKPGPPPPKKP